MAIPALLIGAGVVGVMWASSQKPSAKPGDAPSNPQTSVGKTGTPGADGTSGDLSQIAADIKAAGGQPFDATQMPANTGNPAQTTTTTTGDTGATQTGTDATAGGTTGTTTSPPTPTYAAPKSAGPSAPTTQPVQTAPTLQVVGLSSAYISQYGTASTKAEQSTYYSQQAAAGNIIY